MENDNTGLTETIWKDDKLGRINEAMHLNRFLESKFQAEKNRPFVMNIDSGWGHGKTFFIKHFAEQLRQYGHPVVIFDAWKNDFSDEALLSFISCVCLSLKDELLSEDDALNQVAKLKKLAKSFVKPALPILLAALVKQLTGTSIEKYLSQDGLGSKNKTADNISDLAQDITNLATSKALEVYEEKKSATESFTDTIANLVKIVDKSQDKYLPIYIFVDELDRCRPLFSIELLESIKHLFSTSGVYFIVSTDTEQLCHSIKAVYGHGFDARRYLKRFFDIEYQLDTPHNQELSLWVSHKFTDT
ncbi:KAP family P-loop NTPase fold protein [Methylophaga pinxianii]|uniref:KAP family P-loop NTPase fold protein n=1 Tax=Methylophaga pinxianii TaxID=2881052 RepID=UPI001CF52324|nr:P-loop NTPase fold protein [Methylophaga pinxianii]MCB2428148.1 KAP family NTPase [Methylophaga pinxianii]UPH45470.1 KAP family NTPase [Methylophaga pinxianii]